MTPAASTCAWALRPVALLGLARISFKISSIAKESDDAISEDGAGRSLADGLTKGVLDGAPSAGKAAREPRQTKQSTPSSRRSTRIPRKQSFHKKEGQYIAQGLALGIDSDADLAMHSTKMMADGAAIAARRWRHGPGLAARARGGQCRG